MALHAKMRTEREHLVGAVRIGEQPGGTGWNTEGLSMPLEDGSHLPGKIAQPVARDGMVFGARLAPADFLDRLRVIAPPSALLINCPPRQWPMTGTSCATAWRIKAHTGSIHGSGSFTLIGPPMKQRPEKPSTVAGTGSPSSMAIRRHGIPCRSRNMAK